ncbi:MAG: restriction endonuclease, partial [Bacteroidia bacterium]|nr:restriction endonuclease [Bacteroidia bacterium]
MSQVFEKLSSKDGKGRLLEEVVEALFSDLNFSNIRRQKSGSQYGFDVVGYKNNQCWKAECKNLKKEASLNDIAPKLIWHIEGENIDRFLIVSVNGISNDLIYLLEQKVFSFPIEIWSGEYLNELIHESPSALKLLQI